MKKNIFFVFAISLCLCNVSAKSQPIDTVLLIIKKINYSKFVGKLVDSLVTFLPAGIVEQIILPSHNPIIGNNLVIRYPNEIYIWIHVNRFRYFNEVLDRSIPPQGQWDISKFKKEAIGFTVVYQGTLCIVGCENQFQ